MSRAEPSPPSRPRPPAPAPVPVAPAAAVAVAAPVAAWPRGETLPAGMTAAQVSTLAAMSRALGAVPESVRMAGAVARARIRGRSAAVGPDGYGVIV